MFSIEKELETPVVKQFVTTTSSYLQDDDLDPVLAMLGNELISSPTHRAVGCFLSALCLKKGMRFRENLYDNSVDMLSAFYTLYEKTPLIKFGHKAVIKNLELYMAGHHDICIIDLGFGNGIQWLELFEHNAANFTLYAVDVPHDHTSEKIDAFRTELEKRNMAERVKVVPVLSYIEEIDFETFYRGDYTVVNSALSLHHIHAHERQTVIKRIRAFNPSLVTIVEPDSDHNNDKLEETIFEAFEHYMTVFHALDHYIEDGKTRAFIESQFFGKEIENIVAHQGTAKVERHERYAQWKARFEEAAFKEVSSNTLYHGDKSLLVAGMFECA